VGNGPSAMRSHTIAARTAVECTPALSHDYPPTKSAQRARYRHPQSG
jgi:hypothetical protein